MKEKLLGALFFFACLVGCCGYPRFGFGMMGFIFAACYVQDKATQWKYRRDRHK